MTDRTSAPDQAPQKSRYESPKLLMFGDVVELTQSVASTSKTADGGTGMGADKTS